MNALSAPIELFYSYADADEDLRVELDKHLSQLRSDGLIAPLHARQITAGRDWTKTLDKHLDTAAVILLLISSDFLASNYCYGIEMQHAMQRHKVGVARVIPILLRPAYDWQSTPFGKLRALPSSGEPIIQWRNRDAALADVTQGIRTALEELQSRMAGTLFTAQGLNSNDAFATPYYDIVPERTHEDFQRGYQARMDRVKNRLHEYVDIDLPIVEDGGDW
jgi:hypothetical protein